jgi:hypothetical protein
MRTAPFQLSLPALLAGCSPAGAPSALGSFGGCEEHRSQHPTQRVLDRAGAREQPDGDGDRRVCEQRAATAARHRTCRRGRGGVPVQISARRYLATADPVLHALAARHPLFLYLDRSGADANRARSLGGIPTRRAYDRDEYAPAVSRKGGANADGGNTPSADNRGAGALPSAQLERYCDGQRFRLRITG